MTLMQRNTFATDGWRQRLPGPGDVTAVGVTAMTHTYVATYGMSHDFVDAMAAVELASAVPLDMPAGAAAALRSFVLPVPFGINVVIGELLAPCGDDPHSNLGLSPPREANEWVSGLAVGALALSAAALALSRDCGADPLGFAKGGLAMEDAYMISHMSGGQACLLMLALSKGYGIFAPMAPGFGPQDWIHAFVSANGLGAVSVPVEATALALFGCGAEVDVTEEPVEPPCVAAILNAGYGVFVHPGSHAYKRAMLEGLWSGAGLPLPDHISYWAAVVPAGIPRGAAQLTWSRIDDPKASTIRDATRHGPTPPGGLGYSTGHTLPILPSVCDAAGGMQIVAHISAGSDFIADQMVKVLADGNWKAEPRHAGCCLGSAVGARPPPLIPNVPCSHRRIGVKEFGLMTTE
jgi:hypothetical protein